MHRIAHHLTRNELDTAVELFKNAKCLYVDYNDKYGAVNVDNRNFNIDDRCLEDAAEYVGSPGFNWTDIFSESTNFWGCPLGGVHESGCQKWTSPHWVIRAGSIRMTKQGFTRPPQALQRGLLVRI